MPPPRFDRRVRTLVEVRGGPDDWEEAEQRFQAHGWPVRGSSPAGRGERGHGGFGATARSRVEISRFTSRSVSGRSREFLEAAGQLLEAEPITESGGGSDTGLVIAGQWKQNR
ncbi:hypothetical protein [Streptomyces sp. NPDC059894]|uniref:hypothetical protein n=1 Tax=unclassified Streptomyces TaxID=2593676 RepID=UPI00366392CA